MFRSVVTLRSVAVALGVAAALVAAPVRGQGPAVPPIVNGPAFAPFVTSCWIDVRLFRTLRLGLVDYCRDSLRYKPGALDCRQFTDQVCSVFVPGSGLIETRSLVNDYVFRCPDGPEPPVCQRFNVRRRFDVR
jgi:hypothetical protein